MGPSLRDVDIACLARESIIHSDINFEGVDFQKALCYLRIMAGEEIMVSAGLGSLIPKWKGKKVELLKVTGESGRNMESWSFSPKNPSIFEQKAIIGLLMEIGILVAMGSHCYEFAGRFYLQLMV